MSGILSQKLFGMAKNAEYKIAGFPDFSAALTDLKQFQSSPPPTYEVCVPTGNGVLVVKESLIQFWRSKGADFADKFTSLLDKHNAEFNPEGLRRGSESEVPEGDEDGPPSKRLCLGTKATMGELEIQCPEAERTDVQENFIVLKIVLLR